MNDNLSRFDVIAIVIASLTLIVTQSWNTLIKDTIDYYVPDQNKSITAKALYTVSMTFVVGVFVYYITNYSGYLKKVSERILDKLNTFSNLVRRN